MKIPKVKVCGVTQAADLKHLADFGVDTVGINLVSTSKRYVKLHTAVDLAKAARDLDLSTVAVVMNPLDTELAQICDRFDWDFIQLHGAELPLLAKHCGGRSIIKAVGWSGLEEQQQLVKTWQDACDADRRVFDSASTLACFLLDAYAPGVGGGTGTVARWDLVFPRPDYLQGWPLVLAGGLTVHNVRQAIASTRVDGVDVASGVEEMPGIKSRSLIQQFAEEALQGFAS